MPILLVHLLSRLDDQLPAAQDSRDWVKCGWNCTCSLGEAAGFRVPGTSARVFMFMLKSHPPVPTACWLPERAKAAWYYYVVASALRVLSSLSLS